MSKLTPIELDEKGWERFVVLCYRSFLKDIDELNWFEVELGIEKVMEELQRCRTSTWNQLQSLLFDRYEFYNGDRYSYLSTWSLPMYKMENHDEFHDWLEKYVMLENSDEMKDDWIDELIETLKNETSPPATPPGGKPISDEDSF